MRLPGSEKPEIIRIVEQSHLPARRMLAMLGIRPSTFYCWYDRYRAGGPEALQDRPSRQDRVWNRIPDEVRERIVAMALEVRNCHRASWPRASHVYTMFSASIRPVAQSLVLRRDRDDAQAMGALLGQGRRASSRPSPQARHIESAACRPDCGHRRPGP